MRKNGFTLIELLAVIVILAIIALIATPIILGIINDAREKANERSVELYASAVRNGIAAHQLRTGNEVLPGTYNETNKLPFEVEYDGKVDCTNVIISEDGKVSLDKCTVNGGTKEYSYGLSSDTGSTQEKVVYLNDVCDPVRVEEEGKYTAGDKYTCTVDPNKPAYTFYVLTTVTDPNATSVNLIMDSNIRTGGEEVKGKNLTKEQYGHVEWMTQRDYEREDIGGTAWDDWTVNDRNTFGPITAIEYLQAATVGWTKTNPQTISTFYECDYDDNCEEKNMAKTYTANARMPYRSEVSNYSTSTAFLYDYLTDYGIQTNVVSGEFELYGYWTLSSRIGGLTAIRIYFEGEVSEYPVEYGTETVGVRPVINLSI